MSSVPLVEVWRGPFLECVHRGHAVVCDPSGAVVESWGDPQAVVLPRSSAKMIQALPLVESGAASAANLRSEHLALASASHSASDRHTGLVSDWLATLELSDSDLRCGAWMPMDRDAAERLICSKCSPSQVHNECSGKHSGFLTLSRHLKGGPEYLDLDHPVQQAVRAAWEDVTGEAVLGHAIDGCSAPNFGSTIAGVARAMAGYAAAAAGAGQGSRAAAQRALVQAMKAHPELVGGAGQATTALTQAIQGQGVCKSGADGFFVAILPEKRLGVAVKIEDGAGLPRDCAMTAILARLGVLDPQHPLAKPFSDPHFSSKRGLPAGQVRAVL